MADLDPSLKLDSPRASAPGEGRPADEALMTLLAHIVVSDGVVHEGEVGFLARVRPGWSDSDLAEWARQRASHPLDLAGIAAAIVEPDDRWRCLRYVARMAWKDGALAPQERELLGQLASGFGMAASSVDRVLAEMSLSSKERFAAPRILEVLVGIHWDAVQLASGTLVSDDLLSVTPPTTEIVARVGLERVEVMAICSDGLAARFREGPAFLWWSDLVTWTRARSLGESVTLHCEDGATWSLVDSRLSGLAAFLDRLLDHRERTRGSEPPKVELRRGE